LSNNAAFDDPILGRVNWIHGLRGGEWRFAFTVDQGPAIAASVFPGLPPDDPGWDEVRTHIAWLQKNERLVRSRIATELFDQWKENWYDAEAEEVPIERLQDAITLVGVNFYEDRQPELVYTDRGHFDEQLIVVVLNSDGEFARGPTLE
jgi:hypothetical protein